MLAYFKAHMFLKKVKDGKMSIIQVSTKKHYNTAGNSNASSKSTIALIVFSTIP